MLETIIFIFFHRCGITIPQLMFWLMLIWTWLSCQLLFPILVNNLTRVPLSSCRVKYVGKKCQHLTWIVQLWGRSVHCFSSKAYQKKTENKMGQCLFPEEIYELPLRNWNAFLYVLFNWQAPRGKTMHRFCDRTW